MPIKIFIIFILLPSLSHSHKSHYHDAFTFHLMIKTCSTSTFHKYFPSPTMTKVDQNFILATRPMRRRRSPEISLELADFTDFIGVAHRGHWGPTGQAGQAHDSKIAPYFPPQRRSWPRVTVQESGPPSPPGLPSGVQAKRKNPVRFFS